MLENRGTELSGPSRGPHHDIYRQYMLENRGTELSGPSPGPHHNIVQAVYAGKPGH